MPVLVALFLWRPSPLLILMAILAAPQVIKVWKFDPALPENQTYYAASGETRLTYAVYYIALVAFLTVMAHDTHEMLAPRRAGL